MKKFLSGVLCATLVFSLALSALAISGRMTIEVDPINVQVNGEVFQPTDVNGKEVPVFAYQGTTYAPLRALAEAYGLEVGYDAKENMATVTDPDAKPAIPDTTNAPDYSDWSAEDEAAYQEFKGMWDYPIMGDDGLPAAGYTGNMSITELVDYLKGYDETALSKCGLRIREEFLLKETSSQLTFRYNGRILVAVYPDGRVGYGSAWTAGH